MELSDVQVGQTLYGVELRLASYQQDYEPVLCAVKVVKETKAYFQVVDVTENACLRLDIGVRGLDKARPQPVRKLALTPAGAWADAHERMVAELEDARQTLAFYEQRATQVAAQVAALDYTHQHPRQQDDRYNHQHPRHAELMLPCYPRCQEVK